jgi:PAS domain S-box-containing protein
MSHLRDLDRAPTTILSGLLETTSDAVAVLDADGCVLCWSAAMTRLTGRESRAMLYRRASVLWPENELAGMEARRERALAGESVTSFVSFVNHGQVRRVPVEARQAPLRDASGFIAGTTLLLRDLTERLRLEERLTEAERRFRTMADSAPVLLWMTRVDGLCVFLNETWLSFTGRTREEAYGLGWLESVHFEDVQRWLNIYYDALNERRSFTSEYRLRRHDGEYRWLLSHGTPHYDERKNFLGYIGSSIDITDRRVVEEALRTSESRLSAIVRTAGDAIISIDDAGSIGSFSPAAERIFGYSADEAIGQSISLVVDDPGAAELPLRELGPSHGPRDATGRHKGGATIPLEVSVSPTEQGGSTLILRDMSERRLLERRVLEHGEQLQMRIGQDLHDGLGQLLTGTAFLAKGLEDRLREPEARQAARLVELINQAIVQVKTLAKGLCPWHLDKRGLLAALEELVTDTKTLFQIDCTFDPETELDDESLHTRTQLYLITREALMNAVHHGGARAIRVRLTRSGSRFELSIRDDGSGITPDPARGGLGLASMGYRARTIGGHLEVSRAEPQGTIVRCIW